MLVLIFIRHYQLNAHFLKDCYVYQHSLIFQFLFQIAENLKGCQEGEVHLLRVRHFQSHEVRIGVKPVQSKHLKKSSWWWAVDIMRASRKAGADIGIVKSVQNFWQWAHIETRELGMLQRAQLYGRAEKPCKGKPGMGIHEKDWSIHFWYLRYDICPNITFYWARYTSASYPGFLGRWWGEKGSLLLYPPAGRSPRKLDNQLSWMPPSVFWIRRGHRQPAQITELSQETPKFGWGGILLSIW